MAPASMVTAGTGAVSQPCGTKLIVQGDGVHGTGPDQKRIRCVGRALIGMAAAFDRQTQPMGAGEIHRRHHILGPVRATA